MLPGHNLVHLTSDDIRGETVTPKGDLWWNGLYFPSHQLTSGHWLSVHWRHAVGHDWNLWQKQNEPQALTISAQMCVLTVMKSISTPMNLPILWFWSPGSSSTDEGWSPVRVTLITLRKRMREISGDNEGGQVKQHTTNTGSPLAVAQWEFNSNSQTDVKLIFKL